MALTKEEQAYLLKRARASVEAAAYGTEVLLPPPPPPGSSLNEGRGAFVTLHKDGELRGCIGTFSEERPLYETVSEMAEAAASKDPRFPPVEAQELPEITIEISALTPLREITDVGEIEIGRHGIYIVKGGASGVLLPQVAVEHNLDRESFLDHTCMKAGLPAGCWKEGARILVFEAEIFREG